MSEVLIKKIAWAIILVATILILSCEGGAKVESRIQTVSAMRNVMWKGELEGKMNLDTIQMKDNLYGLGPVEYLQGEILINNGKSYVSKVRNDSTMVVEESSDVKAPFFVYGWQSDWKIQSLPKEIGNLTDL